ncbi:hypothetical protein BP422_12125 [Brevibacillus formosus]|uniref:Uncharacterized protein n=1 Tax=Brevibacillus formosus TaxID=54913 RepID=A0A220MHI9_9BACL|nr:hypothetical protein BP422_12125 [Brevibacillus formosus]
MKIFRRLVSAIVQPEQHTIRFFGTKWNSLLSIQFLRGQTLGKQGLYFHSGFAELYIGRLKIRYYNKK